MQNRGVVDDRLVGIFVHAAARFPAAGAAAEAVYEARAVGGVQGGAERRRHQGIARGGADHAGGEADARRQRADAAEQRAGFLEVVALREKDAAEAKLLRHYGVVDSLCWRAYAGFVWLRRVEFRFQPPGDDVGAEVIDNRSKGRVHFHIPASNCFSRAISVVSSRPASAGA